MNIKNMKITDIIPYDKPPRINGGAVEAAAIHLGLEEVPMHIADNLTPEQVQAYRIADNKTGEIAEWDYSLLPVELKELQAADFDLSLTIPLTFLCGGIGKTVSPFSLPERGVSRRLFLC